MRIGILTQYYVPEIGAPQARLSELAQGLAARGHELVVVTAMPNYPTGRIHEGYGGWHRREWIRDVDVHRLPLYPSNSPGAARRMASYLSFVATSAVAGRACFGRRLDYLLCESPPLFLGLSGVWLARRCRARFVFNVSDLWPESAVRLGWRRDAAVVRMAFRLEAFCYRHAWVVTGQSRGIVADVRARFASTRCELLSNGVDTDAFSPDRAAAERTRQLRNGRAVAVLYAGLFGLAQRLEQVVEAGAALRGADIQINLMGDGPEREILATRIAELGLENVRLLPPSPRAAMPEWVASADLVLVTLGMELPGAVPSKIYEAMASGRAIVIAASGEAAAVVDDAGCGVTVAPGNVAGLADAIGRLAGDPARRAALGHAGRRAAIERYDRRRIVAGFAEMLESA